ncbi:MAG TPA: lamin tail domain-containing protein [candidate division Zixibacteria bacterium]|nr:lamin tail domain-containing protein [candidate division Zixibacteria bacterium]MDD4916314.1 lamin tail domain-containing protein [candidate division Zixibacteria bacterium]MDM7971830.1 lamin tail domain-containing protein [candidate division Zixibacteria bacterium]HOD65705.1 lamin tail domain-containing protein [candidate division Zixibacteria bacterium]HOZ07433.1 lamin tail domain-containing protein [candidate division Zixibacteria bacterium]
MRKVRNSAAARSQGAGEIGAPAAAASAAPAQAEVLALAKAMLGAFEGTLGFILAVGALLAGAAAPVQAIRLNEVLANPTAGYGSEWIELENETDTAVSLAGWRIGDALRTAVIIDTGAGPAVSDAAVPPRGYAVLVQDSAAFFASAGRPEAPVIEPPSWPVLNNTGDSIRLIAPGGALHDHFVYRAVFPDNRTWCRHPIDPSRWDRSADPGGTPGRENVLPDSDAAGAAALTVTPRVFSPDGDGVDDSTVIGLEADEELDRRVEIYDREGRRVWEMAIPAGQRQAQCVWWGRSRAGERLPIGIYIIYLEAIGGESARRTVVIAR